MKYHSEISHYPALLCLGHEFYLCVCCIHVVYPCLLLRSHLTYGIDYRNMRKKETDNLNIQKRSFKVLPIRKKEKVLNLIRINQTKQQAYVQKPWNIQMKKIYSIAFCMSLGSGHSSTLVLFPYCHIWQCSLTSAFWQTSGD